MELQIYGYLAFSFLLFKIVLSAINFVKTGLWFSAGTTPSFPGTIFGIHTTEVFLQPFTVALPIIYGYWIGCFLRIFLTNNPEYLFFIISIFVIYIIARIFRFRTVLMASLDSLVSKIRGE